MAKSCPFTWIRINEISNNSFGIIGDHLNDNDHKNIIRITKTEKIKDVYWLNSNKYGYAYTSDRKTSNKKANDFYVKPVRKSRRKFSMPVRFPCHNRKFLSFPLKKNKLTPFTKRYYL